MCVLLARVYDLPCTPATDGPCTAKCHGCMRSDGRCTGCFLGVRGTARPLLVCNLYRVAAGWVVYRRHQPGLPYVCAHHVTAHHVTALCAPAAGRTQAALPSLPPPPLHSRWCCCCIAIGFVCGPGWSARLVVGGNPNGARPAAERDRLVTRLPPLRPHDHLRRDRGSRGVSLRRPSCLFEAKHSHRRGSNCAPQPHGLTHNGAVLHRRGTRQ